MADTRKVRKTVGGGPCVAEELLPHVYAELRQLAARRLAQEEPGQTLQATALVYEAWLRLVCEEEANRAANGMGVVGVRWAQG